MNTQQFEEFRNLVNRLQAEYASDANIEGVGWGVAKRGGEPEYGLSIIFFVHEKFAPDELEERNIAPIPSKIEGYSTDVQVREEMVRQATFAGKRDDVLYDPLIGGVASANLEQLDRNFFWSEGSRGTLGLLVKDSSGNAMALSNWHVWADDGAQNGDRIVQPATPDGAEYAEGIAKTIFCLPIISSLLEGRLPSGMAAALYGGAAAAGVLAALTDERDPYRRGQDATPTADNVITHQEVLDVDLVHSDELPPLPGKTFSTDVKWKYERVTNQGREDFNVEEKQTNPHVLPGYVIVPEFQQYKKGQSLRLNAALWDYQPRPRDSYHVVAHLVSEKDPNYQLKMLLHPDPNCESIPVLSRNPTNRRLESMPPQAVYHQSEAICLDFGYFGVDQQLGIDTNIGPFAIADYNSEQLTIASNGHGLEIRTNGILIHHLPADTLLLEYRNNGETPLRVRAFDAFDNVQAEIELENTNDELATIELQGEMITYIRMEGGDDLATLLRYCVVPRRQSEELSTQHQLGSTELVCVDFAGYEVGQSFGNEHIFAPITIKDLSNTSLRVVSWPSDVPNSLIYTSEGLEIAHSPVDYVRVRTGHFSGEPITILAYNTDDKVVAKATIREGEQVRYVDLIAEGIVKVTITGGGNEAVLTEYCLQSERDGNARRNVLYCYHGDLPLPQTAPTGKWQIYLAVQNINPMPNDADPEMAAQSIGGIVLVAGGLFVLGCGIVMLADHVFDVI